MKKRTQKDIWRNLYDFPLIEGGDIVKENDIVYKKLLDSVLDNEKAIFKKTKHYNHQLTHQKLSIIIEYIQVKKINNDIGFLKVNRMQVKELPVPKPIEMFFEELFKSLDCEI